MSLTVHYFNRNGEQLIDCVNIGSLEEQYFKENDIKVSMEELNNEIIVYGCPYSDESEESEVIVFAAGRDCEQTLFELAEKCKTHFGAEQ